MAKAQVKEDTEDKEGFVDELKPGTKLMHGQYTIDSFLNAGGFGITYLASDSLDRKVVIKECFPGAFCRRSRYVVQARSRAHQNELKSIVRLFVQEARSLAKLDHPNIVGVHQVFEDNDTAYMALDFVEGRDLLDTIEDRNNTLTPAQIKVILKELLGAVGFIHDQDMLHRDISPDNILINQDLHPVLIDFGAAREEATKQSRVLSALRVVKDGYSPQEFYIAGSAQSPSSDLYALAASFHHLITNDVPPNSQARLAAIASGDKDPYEPIAGRFPDYDDNFLTALDKALAVLPKDRVQSAKEWIAMMDGGATNVTPLKVASAANTTATAATDTEAKSKMPILLGSGAAVALLVGLGVMTMTSGSDTPETDGATPAVAEATETTQTTALVLPEPVVPAETTQTTEVDTSVTAAVEEAIEESAPFVVPETATTPATPDVAVEPSAPAVDDSAAVVTGPVILDTPTPTVRPTTRPEPVELAAVPTPDPLPEPVATPLPAEDAAVTTQALPDQTSDRPTVDTESAALTLPATPDAVNEIGDGPTVDIVAVVPGNEVTPEVVTTEEVVANWTVRLPFTASDADSNVIAEAAAVSPTWVEPGLSIVGVNGIEVDAINDIPDVLRISTDTSNQSATVVANFATLDTTTGEQVDQRWILPVVQEVLLSDGTRFETVFAGSGWSTSVAEMPNNQDGGLAVGDVITSFIPTGEVINGRDTLVEIFNREVAAGTEQYTFAVQRDGSLWVASFGYNGVAE